MARRAASAFLFACSAFQRLRRSALRRAAAAREPTKTQIRLKSLPAEVQGNGEEPATLLDRQQAFGYTQEDIKFLLTPMVLTGQEAIGSMGADNPPAVLSNKPKHLSNYFKQLFAQVTNPPIDPIREEIVMSLVSLIGPRPNLLGLDSGGEHQRLVAGDEVGGDELVMIGKRDEGHGCLGPVERARRELELALQEAERERAQLERELIERFGVKVAELAEVLGKSRDGVSCWMRRGVKRRSTNPGFAAAAERVEHAASEEP